MAFTARAETVASAASLTTPEFKCTINGSTTIGGNLKGIGHLSSILPGSSTTISGNLKGIGHLFGILSSSSNCQSNLTSKVVKWPITSNINSLGTVQARLLGMAESTLLANLDRQAFDNLHSIILGSSSFLGLLTGIGKLQSIIKQPQTLIGFDHESNHRNTSTH